VFGVCLISLGVLIAITSAASFRRERDSASGQVQTSAGLAAAGLGSQLASMPTFLGAIAAQSAVTSFDRNRCDQALASYQKFGLGYVSLVTADGSAVCSSEPKVLRLGHPFAGADWLRSVLVDHRSVNGEIVRDPLRGRALFVVATAVESPHGERGVLVGLIDPAFLSLGLNAPLRVHNLEVLVLDPARTVVLMASGSDRRLVGTSVGGQTLAHAFPAGAQVRGLDGTSRIYAETSVPGIGWHVVAGIPTSQALAEARAELWRSLEFGLATLLIVVLLGVWLYRRLARPIRNLTLAIGRARRGEAGSAAVQGPRELADVAEAFNDMIDERQAFENYLTHQATHDHLTGLPNRAFVLEGLHHSLARTDTADAVVAVAFLDLDRFKLVNDSHGHAAGDQLLVTLGERLRQRVRARETVARFGGDEFVIVCDPLEENAHALAERLAGALVEPFDYEGHEIYLSGSVGLSLSGLGQSAETLLAEADAAMYRAKELGRAGFVVFDEEMRDQARARLATEASLHRALEREEFVVHYQPLLSLSDGVVTGAEALLRWRHPERGLLAPDQFLDTAEETGLIVPIGDWVLRAACTQAATWCQTYPAGRAPIVSVNLSVAQLAEPGLVAQVARILGETRLEPSQLCIELTESMLIDDPAAAGGVLRGLKDLGVALSMDDFGTGYSSLSYLHHYPVDQLKIDRSFVALLNDQSVDQAIVRSIIELAHALDIEVVAEGVETLHQLATLRGLGCDLAQGYYIGRPEHPDKLDPGLDDDPTNRASHTETANR
jgi:diguanylate cyclase (GGDEF)-like protein